MDSIVMLYPAKVLLDHLGVEHVLDAVFPLGFTSFMYFLVLVGNDMVQDTTATLVVRARTGFKMSKYFSSCRSRFFWTYFFAGQQATPLFAAAFFGALWGAKRMRLMCPWMDDCADAFEAGE